MIRHASPIALIEVIIRNRKPIASGLRAIADLLDPKK
jgi:hypothetical protein